MTDIDPTARTEADDPIASAVMARFPNWRPTSQALEKLRDEVLSARKLSPSEAATVKHLFQGARWQNLIRATD